MAKLLIQVASEAGADAVKFQLFRPETLYVSNAGSSSYLASAGVVDQMSDLFADLAMPPEMVPQLAHFCKEAHIELMATPFSPADFTMIDPFVKRHKIASYEIGHLHLLKMAAASGKPLLQSTGAASGDEIAWAVNFFKGNGGRDLTLLQCTASYPAPPASMHLAALPWLRNRFNSKVGLSDHSRHPTAAATAAVALGAAAIEKHFTIDNRLPGPDHAFAVLPAELKELVAAVRAAELLMGAPIKVIDKEEIELRTFACRGIQAIGPISKGSSLVEGKNIAILRPGEQPKGIHPRFIEQIEGRTATRNIALGEGVQHGDYA